MASTQHIKAIQTLARKAAIGEDERRDLMERIGGARSSKDLTDDGAVRVIEHLRMLTGDAGPAPGKAQAMEGPFAAKVRALWISAHHLGIVRDRSDTALIAFVTRQTGLRAVRWLRDPPAASQVIEALRGWMTREAGVVWPTDRSDVIALQQAILAAQARRLSIDLAPVAKPDTTRQQKLIADLGAQIWRRIRREEAGRVDA
jgi:hypothetical protein